MASPTRGPLSALVRKQIEDQMLLNRMSGRQVARQLEQLGFKMSQSTFSRILRGEGDRDFTIDEVAATCEAIGLDFREVIRTADSLTSDRPRPARVIARRRGA